METPSVHSLYARYSQFITSGEDCAVPGQGGDGPDARIVIEIDGPQHLGDVAAYRRDRRKDLLLQTHGYLVLRFLADDLGKDLDTVIDTVLRVMAKELIQGVT